MGKETKRPAKKSIVVEEQLPKEGTQLVIQEMRVVSADRSQKDISIVRSAIDSADSTWNPSVVQLIDLYDYIMLDGHLTGIVQKRIDAVLNKPIHFQDKTGKKVDALDDLLISEAFREVKKNFLLAQLYGRSGMEFIPGDKFMFADVPRKHIQLDKKILLIDQYGNEGYPYDEIDNIIVTGKPKDFGLLIKCAPYVIWKRGVMGDWAQFIEIFGQPIRVMYYDAYDQKTRMELRQVLDESGSSLALMVPKQAQFELKDGKQSNGDGQLQERFKNTCNSEMSVVILGNTETTTSSRSSGYAQAETHNEQQELITESDMQYLIAQLNSDKFLKIVKSYGYPVESGRFIFEEEVNLDKLTKRMAIDKFVTEKVPVADDYYYETYGIPKPDNYDELKAEQKAAKEAAMNPPVPPQDPAQKPTPKATDPKQQTKGKEVKNKKLSAFQLVRAAVADFFDLAPSK